MPTGLGGEQLWLCPTINNSTDDISGNGNNGTFSGMSINNDADGKHYYQGSSNSDSLTGNFSTPFAVRSISFWVSSSSTGSSSFHMLDSVSGSNKFSDSRWNKRYRVVVDGVTGNYATTYINQNVWHHVVLTYDPNSQTSSVYINGVLDGQTTGVTGTTITDSYEIGAVFIYSRYDDLRAYDRVLTQGEIKHLSSKRGVLGSPPKGLGDEQLWLCPSLQDSANDLSNSNNHGTYNGGMGTISDSSKGGSRCYSFDGVDDYITYPIAAIDSDNSIGSVSAWVKTASNANPGGHIIGGSDTTSTNAWAHLRLDSGQPTVVTYSSGQVGEKQSSTSVSDSQWHHVCVVGDGSNYSIYIDGTLVSSSWIGTPRGDRWLGYPAGMDTGLIGALVRSSGTGNLFDGQMDDIRVYNRTLTQAEITHLTSSRGVQGHPTIKGLGDEKLWLCPSLNDSANDISGNGNHGVYQNGTATVSDTDATYGGTRAYFSNAQSQSVLVSNFGDSLGDTTSISMWAKSVNPWVCVPVANGGLGYSTSTWQYALFNSGTSRLLWRRSANLTLSGATPSNQWQHIVIIRDNGSSTQEVYVDGVLNVTSASFTGTYGTNQTWFGFGNAVGTNEELYIDDIRAYGRVLTQEEITHLAKSRAVSGSPYNLNGIKHLLSSFIHPLG
jgi:hypothetical protein